MSHNALSCFSILLKALFIACFSVIMKSQIMSEHYRYGKNIHGEHLGLSCPAIVVE